jgi:hypothetical protein
LDVSNILFAGCALWFVFAVCYCNIVVTFADREIVMRTWHVEEANLDYKVVRENGEIYAWCSTCAMASNVCCALNFQEAQVTKGVYPSEPIISSTDTGKDVSDPDNWSTEDKTGSLDCDGLPF